MAEEEERTPLLNEANMSSPLSPSSSSENDKREREREGPAFLQPRLLRMLYCAHFLSSWDTRMWEFAVGIFMIEIWKDSLLLASIYGLTVAGSIAAMGTLVGKWVDNNSRWKVIQVSLGVQNSSFVFAALVVVMLLHYEGWTSGGVQIFLLLVFVNALGGVAALAGLALDISLERDWVVVIASGQPEGILTQMNAVMRRIDLICSLLSPVVVGIIMSSISMLAAAISISAWNMFSVVFEYFLLSHVYNATPPLHHKNLLSAVTIPVDGDAINTALDDESLPINLADEDTLLPVSSYMERNTCFDKLSLSDPTNALQKCVSLLMDTETIKGWRLYAKQELALASVALSLLYYTVLSFGTLMTAFLNWKGIPAFMLGVCRALSALLGISATFVYPKLRFRLQATRAGLWSIVFQWSFLSISVASIWVQDAKISVIMFIMSVAFSRLGLWMFDLSVTQLIQESIPEAERGVIGGVQNSLQSFLEMLSFATGILIPNPKEFYKHILLSYGSVTMALLLYMVHVYRVRGHLFHIDWFLKSS